MSDAAREYHRLYSDLQREIKDGLGESQSADEIRDRMDGQWWRMTELEQRDFLANVYLLLARE